tara:strand:- start:2705 stop:3664 length:960 start_codon:yes stop_codon:yes gene_type:complete
MSKKNFIKIAKKSANIQISELKKINKVFNKSFSKAVETLASCKGKVICAGVGKSGLIARKVSATLSSIGVSSFFCDPGTARHGDMGQIQKKDVLLIFSYSGNSEELNDMLNFANRFGIRIIGVASSKNSVLIKASDIKLLLPKVKEADITSIVPTSSTTITLVLGDALCAAIQYKKNFSKEIFKRYHKGGSLGRTLLLVKDVMVTGKKIPIVDRNKTIEQAAKIISAKKLGLVLVTKKGKVLSICTDGDARRGLGKYSKKDKVERIANKNPFKVDEDITAHKALSIMNQKKITSLVVSSGNGKIKGICHIHNLLSHGIK